MSSRNGVLTLAALTTALLLAGCSADPLNIVVLSARAPGDKCDFGDAALYNPGGSLDLTPYYQTDPAIDPTAVPAVTGRYYQVFGWQNNLQPAPISVNGQVVDPGTGNDFIADSIVYEYQYTDPSVVLAPESSNLRAVITAGGTPDKNTVPADLVQPKARAAIEGSTAIDTSPQTLLVTFQIFGKTAAGSSTHTNKVTFPVTVYRRSTTPLNCFASTPSQVPNGGACGTPGRDQDVSCTSP